MKTLDRKDTIGKCFKSMHEHMINHTSVTTLNQVDLMHLFYECDIPFQLHF